MFWLFAKKASISLVLDSAQVGFDEKLSGKVSVCAKDVFSSGNLEIRLNWKEDVFVNATPFVRKLSWPQNYESGQTIDFPFEVDFVSKRELHDWFGKNCDSFSGNWPAFESETSGEWKITAYLDIPGLDASCERIVSIK